MTTPEMVTRAFRLRTSTLNEEDMTIDAVISTDAFVDVYHRTKGVIREAIAANAFDPLPEQIPLFEEHAAGIFAQLGSARNLRYEKGGELVGTIHYNTEESAAAARAWALVRKGDAIHYSIGYQPTEMTALRKGEKFEINGRKYKSDVDAYVTTRAELREVSLVGIPANKNAAARGDIQGGTSMPDTTPAPEVQSTAPPIVSEPVQRTAPVVDIDAIRAEAIKAERARVDSIRTLAGADVPADVVNRAITEGMDKDKAAALFLDAVRTSRQAPVAPNVNTGRGQEDLSLRGLLAAGQSIRNGVGDAFLAALDEKNVYQRAALKPHREKLLNEGHRFSQMSMFDVCREVVRAEMGNAMPVDRMEIIARAANSTTQDLAFIWTTSVNARVLQGYVAAPDTTGGWVQEADVLDFKQNERIGVNMGVGLAPLAAGNAAKHVGMEDTQETYKITRFAAQLQIDEIDIINDRLDAFQRAPFEMGQQAAQIRPDLVYSILIGSPNMRDSVALFDNAHGNLNSLALNAANLKTVIGKLEKQKKGNLNLNLRATHLVVNSDLKHTALELVNSSTIVIAGTAGAVTERGSANTLTTEALNVVSDSRLANGLTDPVSGAARAGSSTKWFLVSAFAPTIEVGYLSGSNRAPVVRSTPLTQGRFGINWDIKHDLGAKALDWLGMQRGNA
jgi:phage head maturation protease